MKRLALLATGGALWLFLAVTPVFADGGPHVLTNNNGTGTIGLAGDCAACHRAHTAQAEFLLKEELPGLCLSCHDGSGATVNVVDGLQYVPATFTGTPATDPVLGALRGGGFDFALIGDPSRNTVGTSRSGFVGVGPSTATTSTHTMGSGTVWGNGAVDSGAGPSGVVLDCAKCHNPHGNGKYRILQTTPGADWSAPFADAQTTGVEVQDAALSAPLDVAAGQVRNYTILPSSDGLTTGVVGTNTQGDYWRAKYVTSAGAPITTGSPWFATSGASRDPMNTGWNNWTASYVDKNGVTKYLFHYPINAAELPAYKTALAAASLTTDPISGAAVADTVLDNRGGLMTAWCSQCHTRYNSQRVLVPDVSGQKTSPGSLTDTLGDNLFTFRHGTTVYGCEQCHVSHGSNRVMTGPAADVTWPGGGIVSGTGNNDSRLLKVNNRGTCQLCHDPTGSNIVGLIGPTPAPLP